MSLRASGVSRVTRAESPLEPVGDMEFGSRGHPASVMDMRFVNQALASEYLLSMRSELKSEVYRSSEGIDWILSSLRQKGNGCTDR